MQRALKAYLIKAVHVGEVHAVRVIILPARRPPSSRRKYPPQHTRRAWDVRPTVPQPTLSHDILRKNAYVSVSSAWVARHFRDPD